MTEPAVPGGDLSLPVAACFLLCWQDPTDRALSGWIPYDWHFRTLDEHGMLTWLRSQLRAAPEELDSRRVAVRRPNCMTWE